MDKRVNKYKDTWGFDRTKPIDRMAKILFEIFEPNADNLSLPLPYIDSFRRKAKKLLKVLGGGLGFDVMDINDQHEAGRYLMPEEIEKFGLVMDCKGDLIRFEPYLDDNGEIVRYFRCPKDLMIIRKGWSC